MDWFDGVEDVELPVWCAGSAHRLRWHQGQVEMADHHDPDAELALVAFGGEEPPCLALQRLWDEAVADGGFLEEWVDDGHLSRARLSWLGMALERLRNEGFHEFLRSLPPSRAETMGRFLHSFPRPWLDRAAAAVAAATLDGEGVRCEYARPLITVAIAQRVRRAFVASVGRSELSLGAAALVPLRVGVVPLRLDVPIEPLVAGRLKGPDRAVEITVDERWLHQVWAAGIGVIEDRLVLSVVERGVGSAEVIVVDWVDDAPALVLRSAALCGGSWQFAG